jgi:hypothetical protein
VTLFVEVHRCGLKRARYRHNPYLGKHFRQRVTASVRGRKLFYSSNPLEPSKKRRRSLTVVALEAGSLQK